MNEAQKQILASKIEKYLNEICLIPSEKITGLEVNEFHHRGNNSFDGIFCVGTAYFSYEEDNGKTCLLRCGSVDVKCRLFEKGIEDCEIDDQYV